MMWYLDWFLDTESQKIPLLFVDNQSAIALAKTSLTSKRSKHMDLRFHMVRDHCRDLCYCPTDRNLADPLTKGLVAEKYISLFHHAMFVREDEYDDVAMCVYTSKDI